MKRIIALTIGMMALVACGGEIADGIEKGDIGYVMAPFTDRPWAPIYDESFERSAQSFEQLLLWTFDESKGEFCEIKGGVRVKAVRADGKRLYIKPLGGKCEDFEGWIPAYTFIN